MHKKLDKELKSIRNKLNINTIIIQEKSKIIIDNFYNDLQVDGVIKNELANRLYKLDGQINDYNNIIVPVVMTVMLGIAINTGYEHLKDLIANMPLNYSIIKILISILIFICIGGLIYVTVSGFCTVQKIRKH